QFFCDRHQLLRDALNRLNLHLYECIIVRHKSIEESLRNDFNFVIRGLTAIGAGIASLFERLAEWVQNRPKKEKAVKKKPKSKPKPKAEPIIETPAEDA